MNHQELAAQFRGDAKCFAIDQSDPEDAEIMRLIEQDVARMNAIADVIERGHLRRAHRMTEELDIVVKEAISDIVWDALRDAASGCAECDQ